jgi:deoxyribodipyrimidine photo-lyase
MRDNVASFAKHPVTYVPYLESEVGAGRGALAWLAQRAAVVVSDDFPCFFLPRMLQGAKGQIPVRFELVDSNGLFPMRGTERVFSRAFDFRRFLQKNLLPHLEHSPCEQPFAGRELKRLNSTYLDEFVERWVPTGFETPVGMEKFPIDHSVKEVAGEPGGTVAGERQIMRFLQDRLERYDEDRNEPELSATSHLSAYLHFGHVSVHHVFDQIRRRTDWQPDLVNPGAKGSARGWWGLEENIESFLDELITWREIGYNMCAHDPQYDQYESLPKWAQETLAKHARDRREYLYTFADFDQALTHDHLWNAAQRQLVREGRIHNYLRMLWGKKILEWSPSPREALSTMIELNNRYGLDGRNPNSYSGIFWVLGRYDRAWGPERPVFGKIRYMSSDNTARKLAVKKYLAKYQP